MGIIKVPNINSKAKASPAETWIELSHYDGAFLTAWDGCRGLSF